MSVWLALDPAAGELRGQYLEKQRPVPPSAQAQDDSLAAELWALARFVPHPMGIRR